MLVVFRCREEKVFSMHQYHSKMTNFQLKFKRILENKSQVVDKGRDWNVGSCEYFRKCVFGRAFII